MRVVTSLTVAFLFIFLAGRNVWSALSGRGVSARSSTVWIHKRVNNGCVSNFLNDHARPGLTVRSRGPYGRFYFDESKHHRIVLLAAGSGITPMMAILRYLDDLCLPVHSKLISCVWTTEEVLFQSEPAALQSQLGRFRYALVLSQPNCDWNGSRGRLCREILAREIESQLESTFFLCEPSALIDLARSLLAGISVKASSMLQESCGRAWPELTARQLIPVL